ncbi:sigma-70 family RNA polymerase sigma factor [Candidatus Phycosocius spiralis]|uniref:RNA polymerase sigma factor n=1 Tax=Candidatus Phycosocius spiralis TaxID=2815099 RepID=A0ABQ4PY38_9PROT|nr:sigma-70 family RNA polymerase sigma factor [Candidatus Phycosocius spiralis]GIU67593.1 RNA polymerase sigma factor [Candidatus Phycosocius spiralis]
MSKPHYFDPLAGLVEKARRGDTFAARALVKAVTPSIWNLSWRLLHDAAEAEDVTQETLIRLWKILPSWKPGQARIQTWLHLVTTNLCFDRLRKSRRFVYGETLPEQSDPSPLPDAGLLQEVMQSRVDRALGGLPHRQRAAIILTHYDALPAREVGVILGISVEAVESLLARARRALRLALKDDKQEFFQPSVGGTAA